MRARFVWMTDLTKSHRPTWKGDLMAIPDVGEHVTIYGPNKDRDGFYQVLATGHVRSRLWGLSDDLTADVEVRLE